MGFLAPEPPDVRPPPTPQTPEVDTDRTTRLRLRRERERRGRSSLRIDPATPPVLKLP